jgi:ParB family chromosome partitioning protein
VLRDAAVLYKVDTDAIASKVKQEFTDKENAKKGSQTNSFGQKKEPYGGLSS